MDGDQEEPSHSVAVSRHPLPVPDYNVVQGVRLCPPVRSAKSIDSRCCLGFLSRFQ